MTWPEAGQWDEAEIERKFYPYEPAPEFWRKHREPEWLTIQRELQQHKDLALVAKSISRRRFSWPRWVPAVTLSPKATPGQDLASWIGSHRRAFEFFGGVTELVVPDNLKSGVT